MNGILFTQDNHLAIRELIKDLTRREEACLKEINQEPDNWFLSGKTEDGSSFGFWHQGRDEQRTVKSRYKVGQTYYIKEAWCEDSGDLYYRLDWAASLPVAMVADGLKWHSPLFLPERFARDFILMTDVSIGRLQDITEEDAVREGMRPQPFNSCDLCRARVCSRHQPALGQYHHIWDSINGQGEWDKNPWVIRYCFKLVRKDGKEV